MNTGKITTLFLIGLIALAISVTMTQLLTRKEKIKAGNDGKINMAYAILFSSWIIALAMLNFKAVTTLDEFSDLVRKINPEKALTEILKTGVLFIGLTNTWLAIQYYITKVFLWIFTGNRNDSNEVENNNYTYFLMRGVLMVGFIYALMPVFEKLLRLFFPDIEIPFYR